MGFLDAFRRKLQPTDIGGYGGGTLQDQLNGGVIQTDVNAGQGVPMDQQRAGTVNPLVARQPQQAPPPTYAPPEPTQVDVGPPPTGNIRYDPTTGRPKVSMPGVGDDNTAQQFQALTNWEPHGGKRGFKNSLKSGLMYASNAIAAHPEDPITAAIAGFGTGAIGGTAAPNFKNRLTRQWELNKTGGELSNQLKLQQQAAQVDNLGQVPVTLNDGRVVMVPKAKAADMQSKQQTIAQGDERLSRNRALDTARQAHWKNMDDSKFHDDALADYNSGALTDPADLEYAATRLGMKGKLKEKFLAGQTQSVIDPKGNVKWIDKRTGEVITPTENGQPIGTIQGAQLEQKQAQFNQAEAGRNNRSANTIAGQNQRSANTIGARGADRVAPKVAAAANKLFKQYNDALALEQRATAGLPATDPRRSAAQASRENLWRQIEGTYGGMYETEGPDGSGAVRMKAQQAAPQTEAIAPTTHGFSIQGWLVRNPGKTEADARAFHDNDPKYKAFTIIP